MSDSVKCLGSNCSTFISKSQCEFQVDGKYFCCKQCLDSYTRQFSAYTVPYTESSGGWKFVYILIFSTAAFWIICPHGILLKLASALGHPPVTPGKDERVAGLFIIFMMLVAIGGFFVRRQGISTWSWREKVFVCVLLAAFLKIGLYVTMGWLGAASS